MGAELCLAHDMGGWRHMGAPFGRHAALQLFHFNWLSQMHRHMVTGGIGKYILATLLAQPPMAQEAFIKIGPWGPELIWQLATKYKMSRHQRHLQYVIMYTMTNECGG